MIKKTFTLFVLILYVFCVQASAEGRRVLTPSQKRMAELSEWRNEAKTPSKQVVGKDPRTFQEKPLLKAKSSDWWMPDTIISYNYWGNNIREFNEYNANGLVVSRIIQEEIEGEWTNMRFYTMTYDGLNNLLSWSNKIWVDNEWVNDFIYRYTYAPGTNLAIEELQSIWTDGAWFDAVRMTFTYDGHGNMLSQLCICDDNDGNGWVNLYYYTFTFDEHDNLLTQLESWWDGSAWDARTKFFFTYDENDNMLTKVNESWMAGTMKNGGRYAYTYSDQNDPLTELYERYSTGNWNNVSRYTYIFDDRHNRLSETNETWRNNAWGFSWRATYTFDEHSNNTSMLRESWTAGDWVNVERFTDTYNSNDDLLTELAEAWTGSDWEITELFTNTYDANFNHTSQYVEIREDNAWKLFWRYTFEYDNQNNLTSNLYETWVDGFESWKYLYKFDNHGNCIQGEYFYWENDQWVSTDAQSWTWEIYHNYGFSMISSENSYSLLSSFHNIEISYTKTTDCTPPSDLQLTPSLSGGNCSVLLQWNAPVNNPSATYNIYRDGSLIASGVTGTTYTDNGIQSTELYTWCVAAVCGTDESSRLCGQSGCHQGVSPSEKSSITLYPNPANTCVFVEGVNVEKVEIFNSMGQRMGAPSLELNKIDLTKYPSGIYILKFFTTDKNTLSKRIVVTH